MKLEGNEEDVKHLPSKLPEESRELKELLFERDRYVDTLK